MTRLTVFVALACSLGALAADQPPKLRLAEVQKISPERYRAELTLDPDKAEFTGYIRIQVKVDQPVQTIWLNANRITVREASVMTGGKTIPAVAAINKVGLLFLLDRVTGKPIFGVEERPVPPS